MVSSCTLVSLANIGTLAMSSPGLKTEIETGPHLDLGAGELHLAAQSAIQLWTNHAVFEQGAVFHVFAAQPDFVQDAPFELLGIRGILLAQCIQRRAGHFVTAAQRLAQRRRHLLAQQRHQLFFDVRFELLQHNLLDQQRFEAIGEAIDQRSLNSEMAVGPESKSKLRREIDHVSRGAEILSRVPRTNAIDQPSDKGEHLLDDASGHGSFAKMMQHELALMTGERGQTEEELVVAGIAGAQRRTISGQAGLRRRRGCESHRR